MTFTVNRKADCTDLQGGKDSIYFYGNGCSDVEEVSATKNAYDIYAPALSISTSSAINNAVLGMTANRTTTITNGGNGGVDTVYYYIVYPNGIVNISSDNKIIVNGTDFTPWETSGDTLIYKLYGTTLFDGSSVLNNGKEITISEEIKVISCESNTTSYGVFWGASGLTSACEVATVSGSVSMASGVPKYKAYPSTYHDFVNL